MHIILHRLKQLSGLLASFHGFVIDTGYPFVPSRFVSHVSVSIFTTLLTLRLNGPTLSTVTVILSSIRAVPKMRASLLPLLVLAGTHAAPAEASAVTELEKRQDYAALLEL
jgi:hypothetical protein